MKTPNIGIPLTNEVGVVLINHLYNYMEEYRSDKKILTIDTINEIYKEDMSKNPYKYFELSIVLLSHIYRNSLRLLYPIIRDKILEVKDLINNITELDSSIYIINKLISEIENNKHITIDNLSMFLRDIKLEFRKKISDMKIQKDSLTETQLSDLRYISTVKAMTEVCSEIMNACKELDIQNETVGSTIRNVKEKIESKIIKYSLADKDISERLNEKFNRFISEYKDTKKSESYDTIVKDSINLSSMLKSLITSSIIAIFIPGGIQVKLVAAVVLLLLKFSINKRTELKHKQIILNDLKLELRIIQEKIRDAESKGDNKSKYKLLRIENELTRAIERIVYNLPKN